MRSWWAWTASTSLTKSSSASAAATVKAHLTPFDVDGYTVLLRRLPYCGGCANHPTPRLRPRLQPRNRGVDRQRDTGARHHPGGDHRRQLLARGSLVSHGRPIPTPSPTGRLHVAALRHPAQPIRQLRRKVLSFLPPTVGGKQLEKSRNYTGQAHRRPGTCRFRTAIGRTPMCRSWSSPHTKRHDQL
jgi:hypothetical protein